ncbi:uncharacterized protein LOC143202807 [Rhynchophorus ferrugineus]|uniref:uncharacterized protein LOC143202807 n=1 Tax=Rhynchophorus ferrugineus TaxID=354439 RepID=UPI003FCE1AB0
MVGVVYGLSHFRSILGIFKISEIISCLLATCLVAASTSGTSSLLNAFYVGVVAGLIISTIIFAISCTESGHSLNGVLKLQCFVHIILFVYLLITCSIFLSRGGRGAVKAGGAFGLIASFLYLIDAYLSMNAYAVRILCL